MTFQGEPSRGVNYVLRALVVITIVIVAFWATDLWLGDIPITSTTTSVFPSDSTTTPTSLTPPTTIPIGTTIAPATTVAG
jgi:hypothetical protein